METIQIIRYYKLLLNLLPLLLMSCESISQDTSTFRPIEYRQFGEYWYQGKAELCNYSLTQARYGEIHEGHAVLIFVTEDFSKSKHVKLDRPSLQPKDKVSVLKLNFTKKFTTGIYPYSMMTSVFKPVDIEHFPHALKATTSVQEWCGQTFLQINRKDKSYQIQGFSYFESEGDVKTTLKDAWLEDELWTMIRLDPDQLPLGEFKIIPAGMILRLRHEEVKVQKVQASLTDYIGHEFKGNALKKYTLKFKENDRILSIYFESDFPYLISGWEEVYVSGFGNKKETLKTVGKLKEKMNTDYWIHNHVADSVYRQRLRIY